MDQNKFINTYIDIIVNNLLEHVKTNLQLQTQVKVHEFVVADKDQTIASLTQQLNENKVADDWKVKYEAAEANYAAILGKLKHMDTLLSQVGEMKNIIAGKDNEIMDLNSRLINDLDNKDREIINLKNELEELKSSLATKVINTKVKKKAEEPVKETEKTLDDF